jgi:cytochrome b
MTTTPGFNEPHSLAIRIWHWIFFILLTATIITVTLATYVFNTGQNTPLVQNQLQQKGVNVDKQVARAVSHAFNDKLWDLHTWIGYFIVAFVLGRLVLELFKPSEEKLSVKLRRVMAFNTLSREEMHEKKHYIRVKWSYVIFYGCILVMALTGLGLAFEDVPFFREARKSIKSIHSFTQYLIYAFILIHLAGVIAADMRRYPGLVSGMINGKKRNH